MLLFQMRSQRRELHALINLESYGTVTVTEQYSRLIRRRGSARRSVSCEILSTAAQLLKENLEDHSSLSETALLDRLCMTSY